jgi:hypothetical protein
MSADLPPVRHLNLWQRARAAVPRMLDTPAMRSLVELALEQAAAERIRVAKAGDGDEDGTTERARRRAEIIQQREQAAMRRRMQGVGLRLPRTMPIPAAWPQERRDRSEDGDAHQLAESQPD